MSNTEMIRTHAAFIWSVADLLRGDYKQSEYGKVILPMVVLRRLDCVLEPTKSAVLERNRSLRGTGIENVEPVLQAVSGEQFYNTSKLDLPTLLDDPANIADNLMAYIQGFSLGAREVLDRFDFAVATDPGLEHPVFGELLHVGETKFAAIVFADYFRGDAGSFAGDEGGRAAAAFGTAAADLVADEGYDDQGHQREAGEAAPIVRARAQALQPGPGTMKHTAPG